MRESGRPSLSGLSTQKGWIDRGAAHRPQAGVGSGVRQGGTGAGRGRRGAEPARGGAAAIAANGLNEAGGVACALAAQWPAQAGRAGAGSGALSQGAVSARSPRPSVRGSSARQRGRARPPPARGSRDRDWTLRAAFGRHRPAAEMCDCFHVVLPTWPGAPGSGAPPPRLQPAPLWRVGSAGALGRVGGAQCGPDCALAGGRTSLAFGAWLAALSCISPCTYPCLPPPTPLSWSLSLPLSLSLGSPSFSEASLPSLTLTDPGFLSFSWSCCNPLGRCLAQSDGHPGRCCRTLEQAECLSRCQGLARDLLLDLHSDLFWKRASGRTRS